MNTTEERPTGTATRSAGETSARTSYQESSTTLHAVRLQFGAAAAMQEQLYVSEAEIWGTIEAALPHEGGPKKELSAWVFGDFAADSRTRESLRTRSIVGLDFDHAESFASVVELLRARGVRAWLHTTSSHTNADGAARVRALVPLSRPVSADEWDMRVKPWIMSFPGVDTKAIDAVRLFFVPVRTADYRKERLDGAPLDVDALEATGTIVPRASGTPAEINFSDELDAEDIAAAETIGAACASVAIGGEGGRRPCALALAGTLMSKPIAREVIPAFVGAVANRAGWQNVQQKIDAARHTVATATGGGAFTAFTTLQKNWPHVARAVQGVFDPRKAAQADEIVAALAGHRPKAGATSAPPPSATAAPRAKERPATPTIIIGLNIEVTTADAESALSLPGDVYQRSGELVRVVCRPRTDKTTYGPEIVPYDLSTLKADLSARADWKSNGEGAKPPEDVVGNLLRRRAWSELIPPLCGIVETPMLRPDGSVLQQQGYDRATGYRFEPGATTWTPVPEAPTRDDAVAAFAVLREPFIDFPYATDADALVGPAAVLTMLARAAIEGDVPAFVFDAAAAASGKSLQTDVVALIVTGRTIPKDTFPPDDEEQEKKLAGYAQGGAPLFSFDNVPKGREFGGAPLDKVLTSAGAVAFRTLGKTGQSTVDWRTVVFATGNNISFRGDTCRRCLLSRIEPTVEDPERRTDFRHPDLRVWVAANRVQLVCAALTVLRAYRITEVPETTGTWGSFEAWTRLIGGAIKFATGEDVLNAKVKEDATNSSDKDTLRTLLRTFPPGEERSAKDLLAWAASNPFHEFTGIVEELVPSREDGDKAKKLGKRLAQYRGRIIEGKKLVSHLSRVGVLLWNVQSGG